MKPTKFSEENFKTVQELLLRRNIELYDSFVIHLPEFNQLNKCVKNHQSFLKFVKNNQKQANEFYGHLVAMDTIEIIPTTSNIPIQPEIEQKVGCGKSGWKSDMEALKILAKCKSDRVIRRSNKRQEKRIYFCKECKLWHLTSKENRNGKVFKYLD